MIDRSAGWQRVAPGVCLVGGPDITDPADCLVYAVDGGSEVALIDCGAGRSVPQILKNLEASGLGDKPLSVLLLTHCHVDHIGGVEHVVHEKGPRVICHEADAEAIQTGHPRRTASAWYGVRLPEVRVDHMIRGEEESVTVGTASLRCLHSPGHTPGSLSIVVDTAAGRVLFGQDIHGPFLPDFGSDVDQWAQSMEKLLALGPDILCEGHYGVFRPREAAEAFIRRHLEHEGFE